MTDNFLYIFLLLWQIQKEACALVITAQVWKVSFFYWFVLMILGKSLNASAKLSAWDQDPSNTVKLQKECLWAFRQEGSMCLLGNHIWMGFSVWEGLQQWGVVLVCIIRCKIVSLLGLIFTEKKILIRSPLTYLQIICSWEGRAASSLFQVHLTHALCCCSAENKFYL